MKKSTKVPNSTKYIPNLRFNGFKEAKERSSLGDLCKMQAGKFISASKIIEKPNIDLFPCYGGNRLRGYTKSFNHDGIFPLIGRQGALCGNVTLTNGKFYATEHAVVVTSNNDVDAVWMFYLLTHLNLNQYATGQAQPGLSVKNLEKVEAIIPKSKKEQQKIANFFSLLDDRISTQNKIIQRLETLIKGICQNLANNQNSSGWEKQYLRNILVERKEINIDSCTVYSVSVSKGVINQLEYLGRSFAAKDTTQYNVVHFGDIVYTKSPTGEFPYGIIKQSFIQKKVAVSPLYGVYKPKSIFIGNILHYYFNNPINANNYLYSLVQKGAKNTMSITNQHFLDNEIFLPTDINETKNIATLLNSINEKKIIEENILNNLTKQKKYLLQQMFI